MSSTSPQPVWNTRAVMQVLNAVAATVMFSVVIGAYGIQFINSEIPCPLCLLIRVAMIAAGFGLALNALWGPRAVHYGITLLGCVLGAAISLRQVSLHVVPGTGSYGSAVLGFHLYTWAFIVFSTMILAIGSVLTFSRQFGPRRAPTPAIVRPIALLVTGIGFLLSLTNVITTTIECGAGVCPDDPTSYQIATGIPSLHEIGQDLFHSPASPYMWIPFVGFWIACCMAIWAELREKEIETDLPDAFDSAPANAS